MLVRPGQAGEFGPSAPESFLTLGRLHDLGVCRKLPPTLRDCRSSSHAWRSPCYACKPQLYRKGAPNARMCSEAYQVNMPVIEALRVRSSACAQDLAAVPL